MRITRNNLNTQLDFINGTTNGCYILNVAHPGDGTQYKLMYQPEGSGWFELSQNCTIREMYKILYTLNKVFERVAH